MKNCLTAMLVGLISLQLMAQAPLGFNYQGIARQADGTPISNQEIGVKISIIDGPQGNTLFIETHYLTTNSFGLFTAIVGQGSGSNTLNSVEWSLGNMWLQIELDPDNSGSYILMGSQQLMSVPYALFSQQSGESLAAGSGISINNGKINNLSPDREISLIPGTNVSIAGSYPNFTINATGTDGDSDPINELQTISKAGSTVSLSDGGGSFIDAVDDADNSITNEIQDLQLVGNDLEITNNGSATTIDLNTYLDNTDGQNLSLSTAGTNRTIGISGGAGVVVNVADNDNLPSNELQTISKAGSTVSLSDGGGSFIDAVDDADNSITNEIQDLQLVGNDLEITNNGSATTIDLSTYLDNTDGQNLSLSTAGTNRTIGISGGAGVVVNVADNDNLPSNELQTISKAGSTVSLSDGGGSFIDAVDDADNNVTNEIQDLQLVGNDLEITNNGSATTIDLNTYLDNTDNQNLSNVLAQGADAGNVKITNLADPTNPKDVVNLQFLEAKNATDYAISVPISFTSSGVAGDELLDLTGASLDKGGLISGSIITITEAGVYSVSVQGFSQTALGSNIDILINGVPTAVLKGTNNYVGSYLFDLAVANTITIIVKFGATVETVNLQISIYKI